MADHPIPRTKASLLRHLAMGIACFACADARGDVVYSGLKDIPIPTDFDGVYLNIDNGATGSAEITGWDINPFFGGAGVANSASFQPARTGTGNEDPILALGTGVKVDGSLLYSSGQGGSGLHLGPGPGQFTSGQEGYLGFKFTTDGSGGPFFGWMRVVFTANTPGGLIKDWAYETAGTSTRTGNIFRAAPVSGVSVVTLSSAAGETTTLGSTLTDPGGGTVTSLQKNGAGTWKVTGDQSYTGDTVVSSNGGKLEIAASGGKLSGTRSLTINTAGTLLLSGAGGVNSKLNPAAAVTLSGGTIDLGGMTSSLDQAVGTLTLSANSVLDFGTLSSGNTWRFDASNADWSSVQLSVYNFSPGTDHLFFGTSSSGLNASQLGRIAFFGDAGATYLGFARFTGGVGELSAIPEPTTMMAGFGLLAVAVYREVRGRRDRRNAASL